MDGHIIQKIHLNKENPMKEKQILILALIIGFALNSDKAEARNIVVNNEQMNSAQIQYLDQLSCSYIADGNYWLNISTGLWGYVGGGAQGYITDNCSTQKPGLSERGLLYSPGELLR